MAEAGDPGGPPRTAHRLETVKRACALLRLFRGEEETLSLAEIVRRSGIEKTIAFRLLHTLEEAGFLRKVDARRYSSNIRILGRTRYRFGYAAQAEGSPFSAAVTESLRRAAEKHQVDLIILDNHYSVKTALRNARRLIAERVDVAFEFQTYEKIAPEVSSMFQAAGIPLVAIEIPHPGSTFYGIDNYKVGLAAGKALARWAQLHWGGCVEQILLLELQIAGTLPQLRMTGAEGAIREALPRAGRSVHLDTHGEFARALDAVRKHLRRTPPAKTLIAGVNDPAALGALRAFEEAGRTAECAAAGLGAIPEARAELRREGTRLVGSVAFFPEQYGEALIEVATAILQNRRVPPAVYAPHRLVTRENVEHLYPNDGARGARGTA